MLLTQILDAVARLVQRPRVELEPDDGEDDDGEQHEQADLQQRRHCLDDGLEHDLQTLTTNTTHQYQLSDV